jgi:hypothetical protein
MERPNCQTLRRNRQPKEVSDPYRWSHDPGWTAAGPWSMTTDGQRQEHQIRYGGKEWLIYHLSITQKPQSITTRRAGGPPCLFITGTSRVRRKPSGRQLCPGGSEAPSMNLSIIYRFFGRIYRSSRQSTLASARQFSDRRSYSSTNHQPIRRNRKHVGSEFIGRHTAGGAKLPDNRPMVCLNRQIASPCRSICIR